jgi:hypothetical protein
MNIRAGRRLRLVGPDRRVGRPVRQDVQRVDDDRHRSQVAQNVRLGGHLAEASAGGDRQRVTRRSCVVVVRPLPLGEGDEGWPGMAVPAGRPSGCERPYLEDGVARNGVSTGDGFVDRRDLDPDRFRDESAPGLDPDLPLDTSWVGVPKATFLPIAPRERIVVDRRDLDPDRFRDGSRKGSRCRLRTDFDLGLTAT